MTVHSRLTKYVDCLEVGEVHGLKVGYNLAIT